MCTPDPDPLQPEAVAHEVLPADTVSKSVTCFDTSTPLVATPAILVGQKTSQVEDFPTLDLSEYSELLRSFGLSTSSSSSSSPTLPWGTAEDSSPSFSPNRVRDDTLNTFAHRYSGALDMRTRIRQLIGAPVATILPAAGIFAAGWKVSLAGPSVNLELSTGADAFVNM